MGRDERSKSSGKDTASENNSDTPKMQNIFCRIELFLFYNIAIANLDLSLLLLVKLMLLIFFATFLVYFFAYFIALFIVINMIVVALSRS